MITEILKNRGYELKKKTAKEYCCPCPFCGGEDRFCVWPEEARYWCRQCDAKGDDIQLLREMDGLSFKEAKEDLGKGDGSGSSNKERPTKEKIAKSSLNIVATYDYLDEKRKFLYQACRLDPKDFRLRRKNGRGGWIWSMGDTRRVLYNLTEVIKAKLIWIAEGEKQCDLLNSFDLTATCNPGGAGKWPGLEEKWHVGEPLKGKNVAILPDNDEPGRKHAQEVAECLLGRVGEIKILTLPGLPEKGDVIDFEAKHGKQKTIDTLFELIRKTPSWTPPKNFFSAEDLLITTYEKRPPIIGAGIMPWNSHIIISGETGVGKSLLRLELALHLVMGWDWLNFEISTARKVAIFQYENAEPMEQVRLKRICKGLGIEPLPKGRLTYVDRKNRVNLTLKKDRERLLTLVKESGAEVVIYDCLSNLHASKENDNVQMREVLDSLTEINAILGTSCIVIHHFGKPTEGQQTRYRTRGAQSIVDWAVTGMAFTVKPHEHRVLRLLEFIKVRDGAVPKPILLERDENFLLEVTEEDTLCPPGKVKEILEELGGMVGKQKELADAIIRETGCGNRSARRFIKKAVEKKLISQVGGGQGRGNYRGYKIDE